MGRVCNGEGVSVHRKGPTRTGVGLSRDMGMPGKSVGGAIQWITHGGGPSGTFVSLVSLSVGDGHADTLFVAGRPFGCPRRCVGVNGGQTDMAQA